jgi:hypothetical protein
LVTNSRGNSADANGGWRNHYRRVHRWSRRAIERCNDDSPEAQAEVVDFALAFFVWCFSLRDWLKASGDVSESELQQFATESSYWKYCRDISLRAKHFNVSSPSIDDDYGISREWDPYHGVLGTKAIVWNVWIDGKKIALDDVISGLTKDWEAFLNAKLNSP